MRLAFFAPDIVEGQIKGKTANSFKGFSIKAFERFALKFERTKDTS